MGRQRPQPPLFFARGRYRWTPHRLDETVDGGLSMTDDRRGLDHLMEQNETELGFLSAYGGVDDGASSDGEALLAALKRFLTAGGVKCNENKAGVQFPFGTAKATENGCLFKASGDHLPLVLSDLHGS